MASYRIVEKARLDARNTFGVAARAPMLVEVADAAALPELFGYAMLRDGPVLVLGGGSNVLFAGDPAGTVLALGAQKIEILEDDSSHAGEGVVIVRADAGAIHAAAGCPGSALPCVGASHRRTLRPAPGRDRSGRYSTAPAMRPRPSSWPRRRR